MSLAKGVLFSAVGGAVGAGVWAGVAYASGWEFGILAIVVGGAAGFGMAMGCGGRGGRSAGILAAVVAAFAILAGKFGVAHIMAQEWLNSDDNTITIEDARAHHTDQVFTQFEEAGHEMTYPDDEDDYPPEVIQEAYRQWASMSPESQEEYRAGLEADMKAEMKQAAPMVTILAFVFSFGLMHLLFFGLALTTAYKTGSHVAVPQDGATVIEGGGGGIVRSHAVGPAPASDGDAQYNFFARLGDGASDAPADDGRPIFGQSDPERRSEAA